ncbi:aldo/keto reductase [Nonomuraea sp. B12E4]|uniref:aldo/keto reductase n=1 Tax=Nonomuraea sp. B12E4 TaxID=3153564 RepID=UPI00325F41A6
MAAEIGVTPAQASLAWLLRRSPTVIPIPGTTSITHLEENVAALSATLTDAQFGRLSAAAVPAE